jgi:hypothetical protein
MEIIVKDYIVYEVIQGIEFYKCPFLKFKCNVTHLNAKVGTEYILHFELIDYERNLVDINNINQEVVLSICQTDCIFSAEYNMDSNTIDVTMSFPDEGQYLIDFKSGNELPVMAHILSVEVTP